MAGKFDLSQDQETVSILRNAIDAAQERANGVIPMLNEELRGAVGLVATRAIEYLTLRSTANSYPDINDRENSARQELDAAAFGYKGLLDKYRGKLSDSSQHEANAILAIRAVALLGVSNDAQLEAIHGIKDQPALVASNAYHTLAFATAPSK